MPFGQPQEEHQCPNTKSSLDACKESALSPILSKTFTLRALGQSTRQQRGSWAQLSMPGSCSQCPGTAAMTQGVHMYLGAGISHLPCSPARLTSSSPFPPTSLSALQRTEPQFEIRCLISLEGGKKLYRWRPKDPSPALFAITGQGSGQSSSQSQALTSLSACCT